ncbi:hypothetical protein BC826DRAFT_981583 [Russula brevipes]|nr:hypothetical protein BC826DRAFT_981583 [Russula brevipes]
MSRQLLAPLAAQVEGAQFVDDYVEHPDFRLVAAFFLGWVFLSSLRHVWFSTFVRELMWSCKAIFDPVAFSGRLHEKYPGMHQSASGAAEMYHHDQRDTLVLLLCMTFMLESLSSFLSLLTFDPSGSGAACVFVIAATTVASQVTRVFGLMILGNDLRHHIAGQWEFYIFWVLLGLGTVLSGVTVGVGTGHLASPIGLSRVSLCFRKRFLPTTIVSSTLNLILESYIIIRSLLLLQPPRLKLSVLQDARIVQAGSLLLFDLLIVVPNTTPTSAVAEFIPYSIGALGVLAAFNSSFTQTKFDPAQFDGPSSIPRYLNRPMGAPEQPIHQSDMSDGVIRINNPPLPAYARPNRDIEAHASPPHTLRTTRSSPPPPLDVLREQAIPVSSPEVSVLTTVIRDITPPVAQLEPENLLRREKILSYSNPLWATFGAQEEEDDGAGSPTRSQISVTRSLTLSTTGHSPERDSNVLSPSSTILGSDIIRGAPSTEVKNRMRVRRSAPGITLSQTSSISRRVTQQSWASILSAYPTIGENSSHPWLIPPKENVPPSRSTSSESSKSKPRSKSSRSTKSRKSSTRSAKAAVIIPVERVPPEPSWIRSSTGSGRFSKRFTTTFGGERTSHVRGPRPPPSAARMQLERL